MKRNRWLDAIRVSGLALVLQGCSRSAVVVSPEAPPRTEATTVVARAQADESASDTFSFPQDSGGVLVARVLNPRSPDTPFAEPDTTSPLSSPRTPKPISPPLPPRRATLPRMPSIHYVSRVQPRLELDESLDALPERPLDAPPPMPQTKRVRVPSIDVNQPIPLPRLGQQVTDRASLDDPTRDFSTTAALTARIPARTTKAPFLKQSIPDPYDRRRQTIPAVQDVLEVPLATPPTPR